MAPHWRNGAIGCALWGGLIFINNFRSIYIIIRFIFNEYLFIYSFIFEGVRVRDILGYCGMDVDGISAGKVPLKNAKIVNFIAEVFYNFYLLF